MSFSTEAGRRLLLEEIQRFNGAVQDSGDYIASGQETYNRLVAALRETIGDDARLDIAVWVLTWNLLVDVVTHS